jgi:bifunctional non-homologous end joining protein LigD
VQPSKRRAAPKTKAGGRRASTKPMLEIARALKKQDALAGLERWKGRHADAAAHLEPADVLVDAMRGRSTTWTRIRVNLVHVPEPLRPPQEPLDPDQAPEEFERGPGGRFRWTAAQAREWQQRAGRGKGSAE